MSEPLVLVDRRGRVGILTLNRPKARNAINAAITEAMAAAINTHEADEDIREGPRAFAEKRPPHWKGR